VEIFFGLVLLLIAGAVVLLFAMLGELSSRLPTERTAPQTAPRTGEIRPLEEALVGTRPNVWPSSLPPLAEEEDSPRTLLLVLSTVCSTCSSVAKQVAAELDQGGGGDLAIVVSTGDRGRAERFVDDYGLRRLPLHIDENGAWVAGEFGVRMSPTALIFRQGKLDSAVIFDDVNAVRELSDASEGVS
jgi:hypothetical protein